MAAPKTSAAARSHARRSPRWRLPIAVLAIVLAGSSAAAARRADSNALWLVVGGICVLNETVLHNPAPCAAVDLSDGEANGWAVLKDLVGKTQYLLIPTRRLSGIDDPLVVTGILPNYWRAAWAARGFVAERAKKELPREAIGMAINAANARTQDQLHIHVDCVRPDVRDALSRLGPKITRRWADLPVRLAGDAYRARRLDGPEPEPDPFMLLAEDARASGAPMREATLAVIGAKWGDGREGFILLADRSATPGRAHSEDLLDHSCALARR
jgi:CDP-diacylglycerol pyrophosphatase